MEKGEEEFDYVVRVSSTLKNLRLLFMPTVEGWEVLAFEVVTFRDVARVTEDLLDDSTCTLSVFLLENGRRRLTVVLLAGGVTTGNWELNIAHATANTHSYPVGILLLRPSKERRASMKAPPKSSRIHIMKAFFSALKTATECNPKFLHVDKDFSEISALEQVFPESKVQTCYWHTLQAMERRLNTGRSSQRVSYDSVEMGRWIDGFTSTFKPVGAVIPQRSLAAKSKVPSSSLPLLPVNSSHSSTTNPPPASTAPRPIGIRLSEKSRKTYLDPDLQDPRTRQDDYADAQDDDVDAEGVTTRATAETLREEGEGGKSKSKSWVEENGEKVEDEEDEVGQYGCCEGKDRTLTL
jgi:hypothetical protein